MRNKYFSLQLYAALLVCFCPVCLFGLGCFETDSESDKYWNWNWDQRLWRLCAFHFLPHIFFFIKNKKEQQLGCILNAESPLYSLFIEMIYFISHCCGESTINCTESSRSVIAGVYGSSPGAQVHYLSLSSACICLPLWTHIPCGGKTHSDVQPWAAWQLRDIGWDLKALSPL